MAYRCAGFVLSSFFCFLFLVFSFGLFFGLLFAQGPPDAEKQCTVGHGRITSFSFRGRDVVLHARLDRFDKPAGARQGSDIITT
jgi:hypothetical protein